jgi:NAD(P)-dependent dehydrogenase (short-subunit alcohol dehydrogenase family)
MLSGILSEQGQLGALIAQAAGIPGIEAATVEAACGSGGAAVRWGVMAIQSGSHDLVVVCGDKTAVAAVVEALDAWGGVDVMFNNAGIVGAVGRISETPVEAWDNTIAILLRGVFLGTQHAARVMLPQNSGVIINTASTAGILGGLGPHTYTAAKHGVIGLTKSVANELAQNGIRVNAIAPGNTVTAMTATVTSGDPDDLEGTTAKIAATSPLGYAGTPDDIAAAAVFLASDESRYISGHTLVVDAGQTSAGSTPGRFNIGSSRQFHEAGRIT